MTRASFKSKKSFQDAKPRTGGDEKRIDEVIDLLKLPEKEYVTMRLIGPVVAYAQHWFDYIGPKSGKEVRIAKVCLAFDPETEDFDAEKVCPYCETGNKPTVNYLTNAILRDLQENEPAKRGKMTDSEKKTGFKEKASKTWTPVKVVRATATVATKIQNLSNANKVKDKKTGETVAKPLSDEKYGRDIQLFYDSKAKGAAKYDVQKGDDRKPLTDEEKEYLVWNIEGVLKPEPLNRAQEEADKFSGKAGKKKGKEDYEEEDDEPKSKKGKGKSKKDSDDDDGYFDGSDDDAGSDSDDEPKSKKDKGKSKKSKKDSDDDEDESSDADADSDGDADSDDEPKSKKGKGKSKKDSDSDDDDAEDSDNDGSDDDDEGESDDDEPKSKKGKGKSKKDSDDDEDDADSDSDDEPKSKKGKDKSKKSKKDADSDDDLGLDDVDEDDADSDDEPKSKKGKKGKGKSKKGKSKKGSDDSDDDIPF